ncbi:MAG TPA: alkaline phosphatase family protein [Thermoanaerobaculia bacterium]|nr:alkaline phosphatase family protein [Thermoanaerobaculia bacterium]
MLDGIKHIVVLMMENRSFDNVLGFLYDPRNAPPFNNVPPNFHGAAQSTGVPYNNTIVMPQYGSSDTNPVPDPNEVYEHVYMQMYNPPLNPFVPPAPIPQVAASDANMQGFINDYANAIAREQPGVDPTQIMDCFTPAQLPVLSTLANAYAACDHWFASVPTQTFANRSYLHAGTSSGYVDNSWTNPFGIFVNESTTIFNMLETAGVPWRIYHGGPLLLSLAFLDQKQLQPYGLDPLKRRFYPRTQFFEDIKQADTFPSYVFLEPNFIGTPWFGPESDMHPQATPLLVDGASNVRFGEQLLADIFNALVASPEWPSTLFVIIFDEHGGTPDHIVPPTAVSPDGITVPYGSPGGSNFTFDRLGVRIPAVLVSPRLAPGQVVNDVFDHTTVIRTLQEQFIPEALPLGQRTAHATSLGSASIQWVATRTDSPTVTPLPTPPYSFGIDDPQLTDFQKELIALAIVTAGDVVNLLGIGGFVLDILDRVAGDLAAWFASIDKRSEVMPVIEKLMEVEKRLRP